MILLKHKPGRVAPLLKTLQCPIPVRANAKSCQCPPGLRDFPFCPRFWSSLSLFHSLILLQTHTGLYCSLKHQACPCLKTFAHTVLLALSPDICLHWNTLIEKALRYLLFPKLQGRCRGFYLKTWHTNSFFLYWRKVFASFKEMACIFLGDSCESCNCFPFDFSHQEGHNKNFN